MAARSSFPAVAEQILIFNANLVKTISAMNSLTRTTEASVNVQIVDQNGVLTTYTLPSFTFLKSEIDRLNNNVNSIYNIDNTSGALIQPSSANIFQKVVSVDLNKEPVSLSGLQAITSF